MSSVNYRVTFQRNILLSAHSAITGNYLRGVSITHKAFREWVEQHPKVTSFVFRPSDRSDDKLVAKRIKAVEVMGFTVSPNDQSIHHYMRAER